MSTLAVPVSGGDARHVPPSVSSPEFVGRAAELEVLEAALARAEGGVAGSVFVCGESGIGKTRLLHELERRAADRGVRTMRGECPAFGAGELAYAPISSALRRLERELEPGALEALVGPARGELARLVPEWATAEAQSDPTASGDAFAQGRLFGVLRGLLDRLAADAPLLVGVEDLHWADRSTLELLSSLLRGLRDERVLLVCTYRSDELHRRHPLRPFVAEEERREGVQRVELEPFSPAELAAQVAGILGEAADPGLVARLHVRCEGNAFVAEELLAASGGAAGPLPSTLRELLGLRLEALPQDARAVLRVVAAAGAQAGHRLLATVVALPETSLLEALRQAVAHHVLVHDSDSYAFRHALLEEAAYADLLPGERTALHLALAEALSADPSLAGAAPAAELAHHWHAAHRLPEALAAYVQAGLEAERASAFAEAAQHFERALEIWHLVDDAGERSELGLAAVVGRAAQAAHCAGEHHRAVALGRRALQLADRADDVATSAVAHERVGILNHALFLAGDACWRLICLGRLDEAQAIADHALTAVPKGMTGVLLLDGAAHLALRRGRLDAAEEHFRGARELLRATSDSMWIGNTASGQAEVALWRSDPEGAWRLAAFTLDIVAGREDVHYTARLYATALRAAADRALRALALADERRPDGRPDPEAWARAADRFVALRMPFELGYSRWRQGEALILGGGDRSGAAEALREAAEIAARLPAPLLAIEVDGLARRARVALDTAPEAPVGDPNVDLLGLTARELTVLALVAEGHTNREIGASLFISEKTASVHVSRILAKLGVRSRVEAATTAHRLGLV